MKNFVMIDITFCCECCPMLTWCWLYLWHNLLFITYNSDCLDITFSVYLSFVHIARGAAGEESARNVRRHANNVIIKRIEILTGAFRLQAVKTRLDAAPIRTFLICAVWMSIQGIWSNRLLETVETMSAVASSKYCDHWLLTKRRVV